MTSFELYVAVGVAVGVALVAGELLYLHVKHQKLSAVVDAADAKAVKVVKSAQSVVDAAKAVVAQAKTDVVGIEKKL
jgi:uncharacterized membrane protein YcjF (UPF0283 family)